MIRSMTDLLNKDQPLYLDIAAQRLWERPTLREKNMIGQDLHYLDLGFVRKVQLHGDFAVARARARAAADAAQNRNITGGGITGGVVGLVAKHSVGGLVGGAVIGGVLGALLSPGPGEPLLRVTLTFEEEGDGGKARMDIDLAMTEASYNEIMRVIKAVRREGESARFLAPMPKALEAEPRRHWRFFQLQLASMPVILWSMSRFIAIVFGTSNADALSHWLNIANTSLLGISEIMILGLILCGQLSVPDKRRMAIPQQQAA